MNTREPVLERMLQNHEPEIFLGNFLFSTMSALIYILS